MGGCSLHSHGHQHLVFLKLGLLKLGLLKTGPPSYCDLDAFLGSFLAL